MFGTFTVQCMSLMSQFLFIYLCTDDHSRVVLKSLPGKPRTSDYVNANYIDVSSFQCTNSFNIYAHSNDTDAYV